MVHSCVHGNEHSGEIKYGVFTDQLSLSKRAMLHGVVYALIIVTKGCCRLWMVRVKYNFTAVKAS